MVDFEAGSQRGRGYLAQPLHPRGAVLVLHAWWGLNDFFKRFCDKLASQGYVALAPDLHDGALATTVEEAKELHSKVAEARVTEIVLGAADYLRSVPSISGRKMGVVGFSMGAAWSLLLSTEKLRFTSTRERNTGSSKRIGPWNTTGTQRIWPGIVR